ncbi:MAG: hypothetical protein DDT34_00172 [Firmicutes bacterium]|nr:hypothetical protein [Bacillota bacterium]
MRSMTGFGRSSGSTSVGQVSVELKSVNHRYLDFAMRITRDLLYLEEDVKASLREHVTRGRIEVSIKLAARTQKHRGAEFSIEQATEYRDRLLAIAERLALRPEVTIEQLLALPGVVLEPEPLADNGEIIEELRIIVRQAAQALIESRLAEGERLKGDIFMRMELIKQWVDRINERSSISIDMYRQRLQDNIKVLTNGLMVDPSRLEVEVAIFADRASIVEEVVRLRAHLDNFRNFVQSTQAIGRKMDFYIQEMNREVNTIGSKSQDATISQLVVEIKSELEKVREQVQNLE